MPALARRATGWLLVDAIAEALGKTCGAFPRIIVDVAEQHLVYRIRRAHAGEKTTIYREYSRFADRDDEPHYPINTAAARAMLASYHAMTASHRNVVFGGRLGSYKYLDMHQAIGAALKTFEHEVEPFFTGADMRPGDTAARRDALSPLPA
ncbi:UDP-galactopyranose mutase [Bradyrhizobium altum]|uniref:UDP-galactopyranose mutase n=1 Tax=Bradyrhizobium altum TaxID=1571202 RepID=UPI001E4D08FA|nr:UDP-galactopyranose mutase [Bradyrhizobium altum]